MLRGHEIPVAAAAAWAGLLALVTLSGTVVIACMMPFAAIAAISALSLSLRAGLGAVGLCWLGNQILGFGLMGYPWDTVTFAAGVSLLAASLAGFFVARQVSADLALPRSLGAFVLGFITYELVLLAYAFGFGDLAMFSPRIVGLIAFNDALWFAALWLGWQVFSSVVALQPNADEPAAK
ncbi:MAG: hypothetical protein AAF559_05235 [Pseudomonadota bacterium]